MGAQGTAELDFGAWPGRDDATVTVTGQASITGTSLVECWIFPTATTDHSTDEHFLDAPEVMAGSVVAGTGFTIRGKGRTGLQFEPQAFNGGYGALLPRPSNDNRVWGKWTVAWVWN